MMDWTASVHNILYKSQESVTENLAMITLTFEKESMSCTRVFDRTILNSLKPKKTKTCEKQSQELANHFL
jgi:hypothetical protein